MSLDAIGPAREPVNVSDAMAEATAEHRAELPERITRPANEQTVTRLPSARACRSRSRRWRCRSISSSCSTRCTTTPVTVEDLRGLVLSLGAYAPPLRFVSRTEDSG
jgi:hypothetical protein